MELTVAVVGPSSLIGEEILELLAVRQFPARAIRPLGSIRTAGREVEIAGRGEKIELLGPGAFDGVDIAFFAAGPTVSGEHTEAATGAGATVIDVTSRFRLDPEVPLVVAEVNAGAIDERRVRNIIASPSGTALALAVVLAPLAAAAGLRRVVASTYQGAAGGGRRTLKRLSHETIELLSARGARVGQQGMRPLSFNCVPEVGSLLPGGATAHELQVVEETRKVLAEPDLALSVTAVRVPTFFGHALSINLETEGPLGAARAAEILRAAPGVLLHDDFPTPAEVIGTDSTHVGRLRDDPVVEHGVALWIAFDSVRKGGALNALAIAEILLREYG